MIDYSVGIPSELPPPQTLDNSVPHAPSRPQVLDDTDKRLAIENSLRYFPPEWHHELAIEFLNELEQFGHIYMYRFRPTYSMHARHISECQVLDYVDFFANAAGEPLADRHGWANIDR